MQKVGCADVYKRQALLCALLIPSLVYYSAWLLLTVLRRKLQPKAPVLFTALSMAFVLLLPLLHIALYRGMPDPVSYTHLDVYKRQRQQ